MSVVPAVQARVGLDRLPDTTVGGVDRGPQCVRRGGRPRLGVQGGQRTDHNLAGDLPRGPTSHPVRDSDQVRPGMDGVLVVLPGLATVADRHGTQDHAHDTQSA